MFTMEGDICRKRRMCLGRRLCAMKGEYGCHQQVCLSVKGDISVKDEYMSWKACTCLP